MRDRSDEPLRALIDAVSAAFDAEKNTYRDAAQAFSLKLQDETRHLKQAIRCAESLNLSDDEEDDIGGEAVSVPSRDEGGGRRVPASLARKWAQLDEILSSLHPAERSPLPFRRNFQKQQIDVPIVTRISRKRTRQPKPAYHDIETHQTLCRQVLSAWAGRVQLIVDAKGKIVIAVEHWRRKLKLRVFCRWRLHCHLRQNLYEHSRRAADMTRISGLRWLMRKWWTLGRWGQAQRRLRCWADLYRLKCATMVWRDFLLIARQIKTLHDRARVRQILSAFRTWKCFTNERIERRGLEEVSRAFFLGRQFRLFVQGVTIARRHHRAMKIVSRHHATRVCRAVLEAWNDYKRRMQQKSLAIDWWRHSIMSTCFEAWNLLHRCFLYHKEINLLASRHCSSRLLSNAFGFWYSYLRKLQERRVEIKRILTRLLLQLCVRQLRVAVDADRDKCRQLGLWKLRRSILNWRGRVHIQVLQRSKLYALELHHRHRLLGHFLLATWRNAYLMRLKEKRWNKIADQFVMWKWWRRWKDKDALKKATRAMLQIVELEFRRTQQRNAVCVWRQYTTLRGRSKAKQLMGARHRRQTLLEVYFGFWKRWSECMKREHLREQHADKHFYQLIVLRWRRCVRIDKNEDQVRALCIAQQHQTWLRRSYIAKWRLVTQSRVNSRQVRLFQLWRLFVTRVRRDRVAHTMGERMLQRFLWLRWSSYKRRLDRLKGAGQTIAAHCVSRLLRKWFLGVWKMKATRHSQARKKLRSVMVLSTIGMCFKRWYSCVVRARQNKVAVNHHRKSLGERYFRQLYQRTILWPRARVSALNLRTQMRLFGAWKAKHQVIRGHQQATEHMIEWRKRRTLTHMRKLLDEREAMRQLRDHADQFWRKQSLLRPFGAWMSFAVSTRNCKAALARIRTTHLQRIIMLWRRAFVRQCYVRDIEAQCNAAFLRKSWIQLINAVERQRQNRSLGITKIRRAFTRHILFCWKMMVEVQRRNVLTADLLNTKTQRILLRVIWEEWTHFSTIRSFVKRRQARESCMRKLLPFRHWKKYLVVECRHRRAILRQASDSFVVWKRYALVHQASREVERRHEIATLRTVWKVWRLEFWIGHSLAVFETSQLRHFFDMWRIKVLEQMSAKHDRNPFRHLTHRSAFYEAVAFQHAAYRRRILVQRVLRAWALAVRTCKRLGRNVSTSRKFPNGSIIAKMKPIR